MDWIVIVQFEFHEEDNHKAFFSAHLFPLDAKGAIIETKEIRLTADTPEQALEEGIFLAWLLDKSK